MRDLDISPGVCHLAHRLDRKSQFEHILEDLIHGKRSVVDSDVVHDASRPVFGWNVINDFQSKTRVGIKRGETTNRIGTCGDLLSVKIQKAEASAKFPRCGDVIPLPCLYNASGIELNILPVSIGRILEVKTEVSRVDVRMVRAFGDEEVYTTTTLNLLAANFISNTSYTSQ